MQAPKIRSAIPRRRYQLGPYNVVVLGEIESGDDFRYEYILALVRDGESQPSCYVTAERLPRSRRTEGSHRMRLITDVFAEEVECSDRWSDFDAFVSDALALATRTLGLGDTPPISLM